jgi:hypothetical protein
MAINEKSTQIDHLIPHSLDQLILLIIRIMKWSVSSGKGYSLSAENTHFIILIIK